MPKIMNIVVIDGKEVLIETLPDENRKRLKDTANRRGLEMASYKEDEKKRNRSNRRSGRNNRSGCTRPDRSHSSRNICLLVAGKIQPVE